MLKKFNNPCFQGNYAPGTAVTHESELLCIATCLENLSGLFARNGLNRMKPPKASKHHWFVCAGMLHSLRFEPGRVL